MTTLHATIVRALHEFRCAGHGIAPYPLSETPHAARDYDAQAAAIVVAIERREQQRQAGGPDYSWSPGTCEPLPFTGNACANREPRPHECYGAAQVGINTKDSEAIQ